MKLLIKVDLKGGNCVGKRVGHVFKNRKCNGLLGIVPASFNSTSSSSASQEENCVIVDQNNKVVDSQPRSITVRQRLLGRGAYVLVFNPQGDILVSKRTATKDIYPSHLDVVISGIVRTGEEYHETAARDPKALSFENPFRELSEELGVPLDQAHSGLQYLLTFPYSDRWCQVFGAAFKYVHEENGEQADGSAEKCIPQGFKLQEDEVEWASWIPMTEVLSLMSTEQFTPVGRHILEMYRDL